jgi:pimeloyl-ACP methyl ester carboxylesterase
MTDTRSLTARPADGDSVGSSTASASLFKTAEAEACYRAAYDNSLRLWPVAHESLDIPTKFGRTHALACGPASGEPVLLLPAMSFTATMWYATASALASEFRCYAVDFPSDMGLSKMENPPRTRSDCAAWLEALLDGLGIATASLIGASYGSFLALNCAIAAPARVKRTVLSSPAAGIVPLRKSFYLRLFLTFLHPGGSAAERIINWIAEDRLSLDHPVIRQLIVGTQCLRNRIRVYPPVFTDAELAGIPMPVLLVLGEREVCYNPCSVAERARRIMARASVKIVPNAGHLLVMECPNSANRCISAFLQS